MTQVKLQQDEETYLTPLERVLEFLQTPQKKANKEIYIIVIERRLSPHPLTMSDIPYIARSIGLELPLVSEKVRNMIKMKWLKITHVGGIVNPVLVLEPIWRYKQSIDEAQFAVALAEYHLNKEKDKELQVDIEQIYMLMNSVCPYTKTTKEEALCELARWPECKECRWSKKT